MPVFRAGKYAPRFSAGGESRFVRFHLDDDATGQRIRHIYETSGYVCDPHGAIGHQALDTALQQDLEALGVFLHTAAPCKFGDVVAPEIGTDPHMPDRLKAIIDRPKQAVNIAATYAALKDYLLS